MCVRDGSRHIPIVCGGIIFVTEIKNPNIAFVVPQFVRTAQKAPMVGKIKV